MSAAAETAKTEVTGCDAPLCPTTHPSSGAQGLALVSPVRKKGNAVGSGVEEARSRGAVGCKTEIDQQDAVPGIEKDRPSRLLRAGGRDRPSGRSRLRRV